MVVERDDHGRLKPGAILNPGGRRNDSIARLRAALKDVSTRDVVQVFHMLRDKALDEHDVRAAELWLSYAVGKPLQETELSLAEGVGVIALREVIVERKPDA